VLNNSQWLELGIDWSAPQTSLGVLEICDRVEFRVSQNHSGFSVYHRVCGGNGQFQFDTEGQAKAYLETQLAARADWTKLIAKREALTSRVQPLHKKLNLVNAQMDAILFTR
jgi:hypothetical protein